MTRKLTIATDGDGKTSPSAGVHLYPPKAKVKLIATPAKGAKFIKWGGDIVSTMNPLELIMMSDKAIKAFFTQILDTITVSISGSGTVVKNPEAPSYAPGTSVVLTATPASGWKFDHWLMPDGSVVTTPTVTVVA